MSDVAQVAVSTARACDIDPLVLPSLEGASSGIGGAANPPLRHARFGEDLKG